MSQWVRDIVAALDSLGGTAKYKQLYAKVREIRDASGRAYRDSSVRHYIETRSSDSTQYNAKYEDLLLSVGGLGSGEWGLRSYIKDTPSRLISKTN